MVGMFDNERFWRNLSHPMPRFSWVLILMLGWFTVTSCNGRTTSEPSKPVVTAPTTAIASLPTSPTQNSTVYVKGKVGDLVPLLEGTVYQLQDATGKVWVLTKQTPPQAGEEIVVKGTIRYKPISLNGKEQGSIYIEQQEGVL